MFCVCWVVCGSSLATKFAQCHKGLLRLISGEQDLQITLTYYFRFVVLSLSLSVWRVNSLSDLVRYHVCYVVRWRVSSLNGIQCYV